MVSAEKKWYAVYVKSRCEKKVAIEFDYNGIEYYLPLIKSLRQWSDRKKWIEVPLFNGYIFVYVSMREYDKVIHTQNVVKFIVFEGNAIPIPDVQIAAIKVFVEDSEPPDINVAELKVGQEVEVIAGKLLGLKGNLIEIKGKKMVKVQIETINNCITLSIPKNNLRLC